MNKQTYLSELQKYLKRLPEKDYQEAIAYFTEYFEDAGSENEQQVIEELGSPKEAAAELLANLLDRKVTIEAQRHMENKRAGANPVLLAVLAICAAPVGIPLLLAALFLLLAGILVIASLALTAFAFILSGILVGGKLIIRGLVAIPFSLSGFCMITGTGLLSLGLSIVLALLAWRICIWLEHRMVLLIQHLIKRGKKK